MISKIFTVLFAAAILIMTFGCERDLDVLETAKNPSFAEVYLDAFVSGLDYSAFANSKLDAFDIDEKEYYEGTSSIRITVPGANDPSGWFAGGAFFSKFPRDLSGYNVLSFWGKANRTAVAQVGFGNDNTGNSKFAVMQNEVTFGTSWQKYYIPIPLPSKLTAETGMLQYAAGADENGYGGQIWLDEVQYENITTIARTRPGILNLQDQVIDTEVGELLTIGGTHVTFNIDGVDQRVEADPRYFTFASSDEAIATVDENGQVTAQALGTTVITAKLGSIDAAGSMTVNVAPAKPKPTVSAPTPTADANDVISLFSDAYNNVPVDTWNPGWVGSTTLLEDDIIGANDNVKLYTKLNFVGILLESQTVNASAMNTFHIDIWTPDPAASGVFSVEIYDFGANNVYDGDDQGNPGGDDSKAVLGSISSPTLVSESWVSIDLPLTALPNRANIAQLVLVGNENLNTVYVDNVYFYKDAGGSGGTEPTSPAPTPTQDPADVISLFSDAYTDVTVDTWRTDWSAATFEDVTVDGNATKKYSALDFVGIETVSSTVDATEMTHFRIDVWSADFTLFGIKLVDFGADGAFGGGDDVEHQINFEAPQQGEWISYDIPLSDFAGLTTQSNIAQYILVGQPSGANTIYVDNIYFYNSAGGSGGTEPTSPAPTPTQDPADVISLFSDAYTDVTVDTWRTDWSAATFEDVTVDGNATKKYSALDFVGIETVSSTVDASSMTHFHIDVWSADFTFFGVKLVDFGADGAFGGGDDVEHQINFEAPQQGEWISYDIPLSDFAGLTTQSNIAQYILVGQPSGANTVYVDNIFFHK